MAYIATGSPEGPRCSPVWFLWEDSAIWLIGSEEDSFPKRLRAEPRCAVSIVDFDVASGILRHIGVRGHADVCHIDPARLRRLLMRYLGANSDDWNSWFKANVVDPLDLMIKITPESTIVRDMSYFKTGPDFAS